LRDGAHATLGDIAHPSEDGATVTRLGRIGRHLRGSDMIRSVRRLLRPGCLWPTFFSTLLSKLQGWPGQVDGRVLQPPRTGRLGSEMGFLNLRSNIEHDGAYGGGGGVAFGAHAMSLRARMGMESFLLPTG